MKEDSHTEENYTAISEVEEDQGYIDLVEITETSNEEDWEPETVYVSFDLPFFRAIATKIYSNVVLACFIGKFGM